MPVVIRQVILNIISSSFCGSKLTHILSRRLTRDPWSIDQNYGDPSLIWICKPSPTHTNHLPTDPTGHKGFGAEHTSQLSFIVHKQNCAQVILKNVQNFLHVCHHECWWAQTSIFFFVHQGIVTAKLDRQVHRQALRNALLSSEAGLISLIRLKQSLLNNVIALHANLGWCCIN